MMMVLFTLARLTGLAATAVQGRIVTASTMDAVNSFDQPNRVAPAPFTAARLAGETLDLILPAKSVVMLDLR